MSPTLFLQVAHRLFFSLEGESWVSEPGLTEAEHEEAVTNELLEVDEGESVLDRSETLVVATTVASVDEEVLAPKL